MKNTIKELPITAGVYKYFDLEDKILYVGKAKNLKNRVRSYFKFTPNFRPNPSLSPRIFKMVSEAVRIEYIILNSDEEALILENILIKQLNPKYNILLRDDKTYPYLYIDESKPFPRFEITRRVVNGKNITYYGPFPNGAKALYDAIYMLFKLVQKKSCLNGGKVCLFYQINRCYAPCEDKITQEKYHKIIDEVKEAIVKRDILISALDKRMLKVAQEERFEEAKELRDISIAIKKLTISSNIDIAKDINLDVIVVLNGEYKGVVVRIFMRKGKIISSAYSYFRHTHLFNINDAYKQAILEFYNSNSPLTTQTILTADRFEDSQTIASTLSKRFKRKIEIKTPQRGDKFKLVSMALDNALELLRVNSSNNYIEQDVANLLSLQSIPYRVESFDNSHLMGVATVGAMVVWEEERWDKKSYRRYKLQSKDEIGQMRELLSRRVKDFENSPPPDLWILDGGRANLNIAKSILQEANINLDVIAIAKDKIGKRANRAKGSARDIIYTNNDIMEMSPNDKRLHWIQNKRDEAHRFVISYHQKRKREDDRAISLLNRKGIGEATVKKLINYFGSFNNIYSASQKEISNIVGDKIAIIIKDNN